MTNLCTVPFVIAQRKCSKCPDEESMDEVMVLILGSNRFPMAIHPPSPVYIGAKPSVKYWLILVLDLPHQHSTIIKFADLISVVHGLYSLTVSGYLGKYPHSWCAAGLSRASYSMRGLFFIEQKLILAFH